MRTENPDVHCDPRGTGQVSIQTPQILSCVRPCFSAFVVTQKRVLHTVFQSLAGREATGTHQVLPTPSCFQRLPGGLFPQTLSPRDLAKSPLYSWTHLDPLAFDSVAEHIFGKAGSSMCHQQDKLDFPGAAATQTCLHLSSDSLGSSAEHSTAGSRSHSIPT